MRRFREWLDLRGHQAFRMINPEITFVDAIPTRIAPATSKDRPIVVRIFFGLYKLAHHLGTPSVHGAPSWAIVLLAIGGFFAALLLATGVIMGGEAVLAFTTGFRGRGSWIT